MAVFVTCLGLTAWANLRLHSFRDKPIDFIALPEDSLVITLSLTRRQAASMKVGFAESHSPPQVGLFSNHSFQYFGKEVFGDTAKPFYFFNFWYANLGLSEIYFYLKHLAHRNQLPLDLILVQITTPNNDNGNHIVNFNGEVPSDMFTFADEKGVGWDELVSFYYENWQTRVRQWFNYPSVIFGAFAGSSEGRILRTSTCASYEDFRRQFPAFFFHLPITFRNLLLPDDPRRFCEKTYWWYGLRPDGANDAKYANSDPVLNANPLNESSRGLKFGDEKKISEYMRKIAQIANEYGKKVVFIIPPVYETERPSSVDNVFTQALALVPDLNVVDHRHIPQKRNKEFYISYDHPSPAYFRFLVGELRQRGFLPQ